MLDLHSTKWASLTHAYGDAADIPGLIERLRSSDQSNWDAALDELVAAILHQGHVYNAAYAAIPHLVKLAADIGASRESDELLCLSAYAGGRTGPEVPEFLEDSWDDAQEEARDLILERLISQQASSEYAGLLIAGVLYLSGEWSWGKLVDDWMSGMSIKPTCDNCGSTTELFWHEGAPKRSDADYNFYDIDVSPSDAPAVAPDISLEFDSDMITGQILGLAKSSGHQFLERQLRLLFGTVKCRGCGDPLSLISACE